MKKKLAFITYLISLACIIIGGIFFYTLTTKQTFTPKANAIIKKNQALLDQSPIIIPPDAFREGKTVTIPILMYHHVGFVPTTTKPDLIRQDMTISPANFSQEVAFVKQMGFHSITLLQLYEYSQGSFTLPSKPIIFTFDDGYEDVFENAIPVLKQNGYTGSFGIITGWPGEIQGTNVYANWTTIAAAQQQGMEIVSHTQDHFDATNPKYNTAFIEENLCGARQDIQKNISQNTTVLIYPYGHYTPEYIKIAKKCGYTLGITTHEGNTTNLKDLFEIPRIRIHGKETIEKFKELLEDAPKAALLRLP